MQQIILFAIGNSGRQDDGLGWAFARELEEKGIFDGRIEYRYQLQVEDAALAATFSRVIFVDASLENLPAGFQWSRLQPSAEFAFSTHKISPGSVLHLMQSLYQAEPEAWLLALQGYSWELKEGLTGQAQANLEEALRFFQSKRRFVLRQ